MFYKGNTKIRDIGSYGVYKGSQPMKEIYKGSTLVYQYQPYIPDTVVVDVTQGASRTITLPEGVYKISMVGNAGYTHSHFYYDWTYYHGATGSFVEVEYYSDGVTPITLTSETNTGTDNGKSTTLTQNGSVIVTASGGGRGGNSYNGTGIANIITSDSHIIRTLTNITGYNGQTNADRNSPWTYGYASGYTGAGDAVTNNPSNRTTGAFRVQYLRVRR